MAYSLSSRRSFLRQGTGLLVGAGLLGRADVPAAGAPLKAAVIGHTGRGDYGHGLELIFQNRPGVQLVALADADETGRRAVGAKIGAPQLYGDYRQMLQVERPALVSVAMRHADLHFEICQAALAAGAHLYVEKPFACFPQESDVLLAEARHRNLRIAVAHTVRLAPKVVQLRQALKEGLLGDLVEMRAYGKQDARAGGEDMMVLGTHLFDLMRLFAGDPQNCEARVRWQGRPLRATDRRQVKDNVGWVGGDEVSASFEFSRGVIGHFVSHAALRDTVGHWGLELHGSRGVARINSDTSPHVFLRQSSAWGAGGREEKWLPIDPAKLKVVPPPPLDPPGDWLAAVAQQREPECSGHNAAWAVEMVMGVYHAALQGTRIPFPLSSRSHPLAL